MGNIWLDIIEAEDIAEEAADELFDGRVFQSKDELYLAFTVWMKDKGYMHVLRRIALVLDHDSTGWWVVQIQVKV